MGWFLLRRFVNLLRVCFLQIISRNHSSKILLINLQKKKIVQNKILQQGLFVLMSSCQFRQVCVHYLMSVLMYANEPVAIFIRLTLGNSSSAAACSE